MDNSSSLWIYLEDIQDVNNDIDKANFCGSCVSNSR